MLPSVSSQISKISSHRYNMSNLRVPSTTLLRTFLKPTTISQCPAQLRQASNYMPRHKYAKPTRLDKLHRTQKAKLRDQKLAALVRADQISLQFPSPTPSTITPTPSSTPAPSTSSTSSFPFTVSRTPSAHLPVYEKAKNGGNRQVTVVRKLTGDLDDLAFRLREVLQLPEFVVDKKGNKKTSVAVNRLTRQVVLRGWRGEEVKAWLRGNGF